MNTQVETTLPYLLVLASYENPFPLFRVNKAWNRIQKIDSVWKLLCLKRWNSLELLHNNDGNFWKNLFQQRHKQALHFCIELKRNLKNFYLSQKEFDAYKFLEFSHKLEMGLKLKNFLQIPGKLIEEQFFLESAIYSKIDSQRITQYADCDHGYSANDINEVEGTLMKFNGDIIKFSFVCNWFTAGGHSDGDIWGESNRIMIGDLEFNIEKRWILENDENDERSFLSWLDKVRELLGWNHASHLQLLELITAIMIPTPALEELCIDDFKRKVSEDECEKSSKKRKKI